MRLSLRAIWARDLAGCTATAGSVAGVGGVMRGPISDEMVGRSTSSGPGVGFPFGLGAVSAGGDVSSASAALTPSAAALDDLICSSSDIVGSLARCRRGQARGQPRAPALSDGRSNRYPSKLACQVADGARQLRLRL